jgi:hypothetical protein
MLVPFGSTERSCNRAARFDLPVRQLSGLDATRTPDPRRDIDFESDLRRAKAVTGRTETEMPGNTKITKTRNRVSKFLIPNS